MVNGNRASLTFPTLAGEPLPMLHFLSNEAEHMLYDIHIEI